MSGPGAAPGRKKKEIARNRREPRSKTSASHVPVDVVSGFEQEGRGAAPEGRGERERAPGRVRVAGGEPGSGRAAPGVRTRTEALPAPGSRRDEGRAVEASRRAEQALGLLEEQAHRLESALAGRDFLAARNAAGSIAALQASVAGALAGARRAGAAPAQSDAFDAFDTLDALDARLAALQPRLAALVAQAPRPSFGLGLDLVDPMADAAEAAAWVAASEASGKRTAVSGPAPARAATDAEARPEERYHGPQTAATYFAVHRSKVRAAILDRLAQLAWPAPHPQLVWDAEPARLAELFDEAFLAAYGNWNLARELPALLHPIDPWRVIDRYRDLVSGAPGVREGGEPARGGMTWEPLVGAALALEVEGQLRTSLGRLGRRYVAQQLAHGPGVRVTAEMLVLGHPFDRAVARLLCAPGVVRSGRGAARGRGAAEEAPVQSDFRDGLRVVAVQWQGERDARLWNWVRAEPADATREEVAAALYSEDGELHTEHAYALTAAPPYFQVPARWAREISGARAYAPPEQASGIGEGRHESAAGGEGVAGGEGAGGDEGGELGALALADSALADEAAAQQAPRRAGPAGELSRGELGALAQTLERGALQLELVSQGLAAWGLAYVIGPARRWIERHRAVLFGASAQVLRRWAPIVEGQQRVLFAAGGELGEVLAAVRGLAPLRDSPQARAARQVVQAFALAMGESHLVASAAEQLALARRLKAELPLQLLEPVLLESRGQARDAAEVAAERAGERSPGAGDAGAGGNGGNGIDGQPRGLAEQRGLEQHALALRQAQVSGVPLDPGYVEAVAVAAMESAHRERIAALIDRGELMQRQLERATGGGLATLAGLLHGDLRGLAATLTRVQRAARQTVVTMDERTQHWMAEHSPAVARAADGAAASRRFAAELVAERRRNAVAAKQELAALAEREGLRDLFQRVVDTIQEVAIVTACLELAVLVGVSVVASFAGAAAGGLVRGALLAEVAADSAAFYRGATLARGAGTAANLVTDAAVNALGQTVVSGGPESAARTFAVNLLGSATVLAALRPLRVGFDDWRRLEQQTARLWTTVRGGKVLLAHGAVIGAELITGAALGYVVERMVPRAGALPGEQEALSWVMQGAAMGIGRCLGGLAGKQQQRLALLGEQGVHLRRRARAQQRLAAQLESSADPASALRLLDEHGRLLDAEGQLLRDPHGAVAQHLDPQQLAVLRDGHAAAVAELASPSLVLARLSIAGLQPLSAGGAAWSGTRAQIEAALRGAGPAVGDLRHDAGARRWTAELEGRQLTFIELEGGGPRGLASGAKVDSGEGAAEGARVGNSAGAGAASVAWVPADEVATELFRLQQDGGSVRDGGRDVATGRRRYRVELSGGRTREIVETEAMPRPGAGSSTPTPEQAKAAQDAADRAGERQRARDRQLTALIQQRAEPVIADTVILGAGQGGTLAFAHQTEVTGAAPGVDITEIPPIFNIAEERSMFGRHGDLRLGQRPRELAGSSKIRQPGELTPDHDAPISAENYVRSLELTGYDAGMVTYQAKISAVEARPAGGWGEGVPPQVAELPVRITAGGKEIYVRRCISSMGLGAPRKLGRAGTPLVAHEAELAAAGRLVYAQERLTLPGDPTHVAVVGDGPTGAWACEAAIRQGVKKVYWIGGSPKSDAKLTAAQRAELASRGLTDTQMDTFCRSYNCRNEPTFHGVERGQIELRAGLVDAILESSTNQVTVTLGDRSQIQVDGIVVSIGQEAQMPKGMALAEMKFRMVLVKHGGKPRLVALEAVDPVDGHLLGIRIEGAQVASPGMERWVVRDEQQAFSRLLGDQTTDRSVPEDSFGVKGSIYQSNVDVPLSMSGEE